MGYSNVAGDLNVYSDTSTSTLTVRGDTLLQGNLTATAGFNSFGNVTAGNLVVTGNFTVTATNTQVSNALSINNAGTATAIKVVQYEGGGPGHTHNVAEFWDFQTLAMVIDPEGNVAIHQARSDGYAFSVNQGASIDQLTLGTPLTVSSGGTGSATTTQNYIFAGPSVGSAGAPSFRALVSADLPSSISVSNVSANGAALYSLNSSNLVGNVANANVALVVSQASQPNITSVGTLTGLNVSGTLSATLHVGNASALSNLNSSNLVGVVASATTALVVSQASQPNITSVGTLTGLNVSGLLIASNGSGISNLNSSNLVGNVANANVALVVSQASQPNITSVGTLTGLNVQGLLIVSNGSGISNLNSSNLVGNVANANVALVVSQASQPNITSIGTLTGLNVSGLLIASNGSGISNLNSSNLVGNVANANVALVVSQASQPNITSVGTLTGLNVSGLLIASNASGLSNVNGSNVSTVPTAQSVTVAAQPNITSVGTLTGLNVQGLLIASNGSGISNLNSSNLVGNVANANVALVVSQASQPNITSVGTLTGLNVQGFLVASNASGLSNLSASNVVLGTLSTSVFPTSGVTAGSYGSSANVSQVSVDTYGRVTAAANVAISSSQWTTGTGNIYYLSNVGIGTSAVSANLSVTGNVYVSNALTSTNAFHTNITSTNDLVSLGQYLIPSTANSSIITQWLGRYSSSVYGVPWNAPSTSRFTFFNNSNTIGYTYASLLMDGRVMFNIGPSAGYGPAFFYPATNQFSYMTGGQFSSVNTLQTNMTVRLPDGNVFCMNSLNTVNGIYWGLYNPDSQAWYTTTAPSLSGFSGFSPPVVGMCLGPDSNVYCAPYNWSNIGVFNYRTTSFSWVPIAERNGGTLFQSATLTTDGRIVFTPIGTSNVGIFNPSTWSYSNIGTQLSASGGSAGYAASTILPNGNIFMASTSNSSYGATIFNPSTGTVQNIVTTGSRAYSAVSPPTPDGRIFLFPNAYNGGATLDVYNWITGSSTNVSGSVNGNTQGGANGLMPLLPDGRIIVSPAGPSLSMGIIETGIRVPPEYCYSIFFAKN